jgi:hypothetical protein
MKLQYDKSDTIRVNAIPPHVFSEYLSYDFGDHVIGRLELSAMGSVGSDGFYECLEYLEFPVARSTVSFEDTTLGFTELEGGGVLVDDENEVKGTTNRA